MPSRPNSAIRVPVMVATSLSLPSSAAKACASQTVMVRPGLRTDARNRKYSPRAGATRLVLNSTVRTAASSGISEKAAYPQAVSSAVVMMPAWTKPCCCVYAMEYGILNSISPGFRSAISMPNVAMAVWRAKLVRTRPSKFSSFGVNLAIGRLVVGCVRIADEEAYPVPKVGVFEKSDSVTHDLLPRQRTKLARRQTRVAAQLRRQMRLIAITRFGSDMRKTSTSKGHLLQRAAETLNRGISLGRKPGALAKMTLQRTGNDTGGGGQRGNAHAAIRRCCR